MPPDAAMNDGETAFNFFLPISKVDKEKRMVYGYASTPTKDFDNEIISLDAIKAALPGYMQWKNIREMHGPSAVGVTKEAHVDDHGLYISAKVVDDVAWKKVQEEVYKGFSIGGRKLAKSGDTITRLNLVEISLVDRPANPDCKIDTIKGIMEDVKIGEVDWTTDDILDLTKDITLDGVERGLLGRLLAKFIGKREFSSGEREQAADSGEALPDGSFPIKNKEDLKNAIKAYGRAKDKAKAKSHIISRARALGATDVLPEGWGKMSAALDIAKASPDLFQGDRLDKGMRVVYDLTSAFEGIRQAQRSLAVEGKNESDSGDSALSKKLGDIASQLAAVISQKAEHEGAEALTLSDADDAWVNSILERKADGDMTTIKDAIAKRSSQAVKGFFLKAAEHVKAAGDLQAEGHKCMKACAQMHGDHVRVGKADKPDFDHEAAMKHLTKAHKCFQGAMEKMELAHGCISKGAALDSPGAISDGGILTVIGQPTEGEVPWYHSDKPYAGKAVTAGGDVTELAILKILDELGLEVTIKGEPEADDEAKKAAAAKIAKDAAATAGTDGEGLNKATYTKDEVTLMVENAALKAVNKVQEDAMNRTPGGPRRAVAFSPALVKNADGDDTNIFEGVKVDPDDPSSASKGAARVITNMINKNMGRSAIFDADFHGKAGIKANG